MSEKVFQIEVDRHLREMMGKGGLYYYRPPDLPPTPSSRFMLEKPADIMIVLPGGISVLVELKTHDTENFPLRKIRESQWKSLGLHNALCDDPGQTLLLVNFRLKEKKGKFRKDGVLSGYRAATNEAWALPWVRVQSEESFSIPLSVFRQEGFPVREERTKDGERLWILFE